MVGTILDPLIWHGPLGGVTLTLALLALFILVCDWLDSRFGRQ